MDIICTCVNSTSEMAGLFNEWSDRLCGHKVVSRNTRLILAKKGDLVIGFGQLLLIDDVLWGRRWGLVENIYVSEAYRQQQVATKIMEYIEKIARMCKCEFIKLTSGFEKAPAHALYKSLGYVEGTSWKKKLLP